MPFTSKASRIQVNVQLRAGQERRAALLRRLGAALRDGDDTLERLLRAVVDDVETAGTAPYADRLAALETAVSVVVKRLEWIEKAAEMPVAGRDLGADRVCDRGSLVGSSSTGASVAANSEPSLAPSVGSVKVQGGGGVGWFVGTGPGRRLTEAGRAAIVAAWRADEAAGVRPSVVSVAERIGTTADTVRAVLRAAGIRLRRG